MTKQIFFPGAVILIIAGGLLACTSGKGALRRGDYSTAVFSAVQRLRQNPDHRKSKQVLQMSYAAAVQHFDNEALHLINSGQPFKWRSAIENYTRINQLYEEIRTTPGALAVIPQPETRFQQIEDLKVKAAEEAYLAGVEAMMNDSRSSYRKAHALFAETNRFVPGYREAIEMQEKARENATLFVIVEQTRFSETPDQNYEQDLQSCRLDFVRFFSRSPANPAKYMLWVESELLHFVELPPVVTRSETAFLDSVRVGERKMGDKKVPVFEKVTATAVVFSKTFRAEAVLRVVAHGSDHEVAFNHRFERAAEERESWATFTGDERALPERIKRLTANREPRQSRVRQLLHKEIEMAIRNEFCPFLDRY
jgi:hypothetical protein